jgi:hypothetical protein
VGHRVLRLAGIGALLCGAALPATAQNVSNQAWIGQTGDTNTIAITQTGVGNSAGANASTLEINQEGRFNALTIDQFGWNNKSGSSPVLPADAPQGINQHGDRNSIDISQTDGSSNGANRVGAVLQEGPAKANAIANKLVVVQSAAGGDGSASHAIGFVQQTSTIVDLGANIAELFQFGGTAAAGNAIERVVQQGYDNLVRIVQAQSDNRVREARQVGSGNAFIALQGNGSSNTVVDGAQYGELNRATIAQSGNRNYVASVLQNNERVAISGNTLVVTLAGDDNGGDGLGGPGAFSLASASGVSVYQGTFAQIGDDNDIRFTVNGGDGNLFGVSQEGNGNGAIVAVARRSSANEIAVVQIGDDNNMAAAVIGEQNAIGTTMHGERNRVNLSQDGKNNAVSVSIDGNDNNGNSPAMGGFAGELAIRAVAAGLVPGKGLQSGSFNAATIRIASGNGNLFAFSQHGERNEADFEIVGNSNQSLVTQQGDMNKAQLQQTGTNNSMVISQF